jgi:hypothetical protein
MLSGNCMNLRLRVGHLKTFASSTVADDSFFTFNDVVNNNNN